ncbi:GMC family oxidoreductase N-terminal domain-containing protein [Nocardia yamanashiensis]|uniref:GMC family oxidoreductase N-terminal domain-containing protein n=1 Tax=Nocardia yamanashiensis TaxID=209247 RepID=UPI001E4B57C4|nr:GMC family oxidoreductase N-terminal domain-containing protein [Nocardia yamanashiensis]UGT43893.1 GMC family oxidoreductase N-terminal domain-containing protein [Nocardia yamanashiensis]
MPLTFFETMSGELYDADGRPHHVAMDLRCESGRALGFVTNGRARITGTLRAAPWVDGAAVTGTLIALPVTRRLMSYELDFRDGDDRAWRLTGRKDVRWGRGTHASLTNLDTTLWCEGREMAHGRMQFFANDYPSFLRSFQPWVSLRADLPDGAKSGPAFTDRQRATVLALAETLFAPDGAVHAADASTVDRADALIADMPPLMRSGIRVALRSLEAAARTRHGKGWAALSPEVRHALVADLRRSRALRHALDAVESPLRIAHFSDRRYLDAIGAPRYAGAVAFTPGPGEDETIGIDSAGPLALGVPGMRPGPGMPGETGSPGKQPGPGVSRAFGHTETAVHGNGTAAVQPGWMANVSTPRQLSRRELVDCDVVVVGSGAGGAAVAARLTERGLGVVIVEEGEYARRTEFAGELLDRTRKYWRDGGYNLAVGNTVLGISTGRVVGGTTAINSGTAFRTPEAVLEEWRGLGFPSDFAPETFGGYLDEVSAELGIAPAERRYLGRVADIIGAGADAMGAAHGPLPRNAVGCDGQSQCVYGCPTDAKRSANVSWVPRALKGGAQLFTGMGVTRVLMNGQRAIGVLAEGQDAHGAPRTLEIRSRAVVVATGTLMTPLLLRRNGINLPHLGRNLSVHPSLGAIAVMPTPGDPWTGIPQGYHVDGMGDPLVTFEGVTVPPQFAAAMLPFHGPELAEWMNRWTYTEQFGAMVRDTGTGSVGHGPGGAPLVRYRLTPRVQAALQHACAGLAELFLRGGADAVALPVAGLPAVRDLAQVRALAGMSLHPRQLRMMGPHPLGTARMGADARTAVVDFEHRVFGTSGLYVADGSVVPTSLGVNPQVTIMAFALRAADAIAAELR